MAALTRTDGQHLVVVRLDRILQILLSHQVLSLTNLDHVQGVPLQLLRLLDIVDDGDFASNIRRGYLMGLP